MISLEQIEIFFLVFIRIGALLFMAPIFGSSRVQIRVKTGLALIMTFLLLPAISYRGPEQIGSIWDLSVGLLGELLIGIVIGFMIGLIFEAVKLAGQLVGFQMGFGIVNIIDPVSGGQYSVIAQLVNIMALLIFLSIDGHHIVLHALSESFETIPLLGFSFSGGLLDQIIRLTGGMYSIALKIGAPIIAISLFASVALGLIARTVPQINVFIVGFPLKIAAGLLGVGFCLPYVATFLRELFSGIETGFLPGMG
jgi:flagellar biosynthetic protein FliR